jgi:hypothetical protein
MRESDGFLTIGDRLLRVRVIARPVRSPHKIQWLFCCRRCARLVRTLFLPPDDRSEELAPSWACRHCHQVRYTSVKRRMAVKTNAIIAGLRQERKEIDSEIKSWSRIGTTEEKLRKAKEKLGLI